MQTNYYVDDDILELKFNENPIVKEISQDWNIHISYDKDNNIVEIVILDAKKLGLYPLMLQHVA